MGVPTFNHKPIHSIHIDSDTQAREAINEATVSEYAAALIEGEALPPVVAFFDGVNYHLADGFHRYHANCRVGATTIDCQIHAGTLQDAKLYAYGANKAHGLQRTNADKRKAVAGMLADFSDWSDVRIARHVGVSDKTVAAHRKPILGISEDAPVTRTVERGGKTYQQDVSGLQRGAHVAHGEVSLPKAHAGISPKPDPVQKPAAATKPEAQAAAHAPAPIPEDDRPSDEEIAEAHQAEAETLALFIAAMEGDEPLAVALREVKRLTHLTQTLQSRLTGLMNEKSELICRIKALQRKVGNHDVGPALPGGVHAG